MAQPSEQAVLIGSTRFFEHPPKPGLDSASTSGEDVGPEVADYRGVAVEVPQDQIILDGFGDGDGPYAAGTDEASANRGISGVNFDAVEPFVDACRKGGIAFVEPDQLVVRLGIHLQHKAQRYLICPNAPIALVGLWGYDADMAPVVIEVDSRRRISLGKLGHHDTYLATEQSDGTIVLEPAITLTAAEHAYLRNTQLQHQIEDNRAHPERRRPRPPRDTARLGAPSLEN